MSMQTSIEMSAQMAGLEVPSMASGGVLAELSIGAWNPQRLDRTVTDEVHVSKGTTAEAGKWMKPLFPGVPQFTQIKTLEMRARAYHRQNTVSFGDSGQRWLVTPLIPDYVAGITMVEQEFWGVVESIQQDYPRIMLAAQTRLAATFDLSQYPIQEDVPKQFRFHHVRIPCPQANDYDRIAGVGNAVMREEFERHMQHVQKGMVDDFAAGTRKVLVAMSERLDFGGDEDKKTFRNSLVDNVRDWSGRMEKFNAALNLPEVAVMHRDVSTVLELANPEVLRGSAEVRRQVKSRVDGILSKMSI